MGEVAVSSIAPALAAVHADSNAYRQRATAALDRAPAFCWDAVAEKFSVLLHQSMGEGWLEHACKEC